MSDSDLFSYLCLGIPKSWLYGIGTVALQERDHIIFADHVGIPVIIIEQLLRNAQIGGLRFSKPFLLDQTSLWDELWSDQAEMVCQNAGCLSGHSSEAVR